MVSYSTQPVAFIMWGLVACHNNVSDCISFWMDGYLFCGACVAQLSYVAGLCIPAIVCVCVREKEKEKVCVCVCTLHLTALYWLSSTLPATPSHLRNLYPCGIVPLLCLSLSVCPRYHGYHLCGPSLLHCIGRLSGIWPQGRSGSSQRCHHHDVIHMTSLVLIGVKFLH